MKAKQFGDPSFPSSWVRVFAKTEFSTNSSNEAFFRLETASIIWVNKLSNAAQIWNLPEFESLLLLHNFLHKMWHDPRQSYQRRLPNRWKRLDQQVVCMQFCLHQWTYTNPILQNDHFHISRQSTRCDRISIIVFSRFRAKMAVFQTCFWVGFLGLRIRPALNLPRQNKKHNIPCV